MVSIQINGTKTLLPASPTELTFSQYKRLIENVGYDKAVEERDWLAAFNILAGTSFKEITSLEDHTKLYGLIEWAIEGFQYTLSKEPFKWNGAPMELPTTNSLSIGQAITAKQAITKYKYLESSAAAIIAIYIQPLVDGGAYSLARAREIEKQIEEMPAQIVWTYGFFLHRKLIASGLLSSNTNSAVKINLKIWLRLMLLNLQVLGSLLYSLTWRLFQHMRKFILLIRIKFIGIAM